MGPKKRYPLIIVLGLTACGQSSGGKAHDDAAVNHSDGMMLTGTTDVTGALGTSLFHLKYGAIKRGATESEPIWVCAADVPVTYAQCDSTMGGPDRMMFLGPFIYDQNGAPKWGFAQTWLYRVGTSPMNAWANSGTLSVSFDDPDTGALELTMSVDFGQSGPTAGSVAIHP